MMLRNRQKTPRPRQIKNARKGGFTLAEMAIVLGIAGLIVGSIWVASGNIWTHYKVNRTMQQIMTSMNNIRDGFTSLSRFPASWGTAGADITSNMDQLSLLPVDMRSDPHAVPGAATTTMYHELSSSVAGGSFHVFSENDLETGAPRAVFRFALKGLSTSACSNLLMAVPLSDPQVRIVVATVVNSTGSKTSGVIANGVAATAGVTPMLSDTAKIWCATPLPNNDELDLDFKLH